MVLDLCVGFGGWGVGFWGENEKGFGVRRLRVEGVVWEEGEEGVKGNKEGEIIYFLYGLFLRYFVKCFIYSFLIFIVVLEILYNFIF